MKKAFLAISLAQQICTKNYGIFGGGREGVFPAHYVEL